MRGGIRQYDLRVLPIEEIEVLNSRQRNEEQFERIVQNIERIGLKKPITVTERVNLGGGKRYLLICGEGRLLAFKRLQQESIPAIVLEVSDEDAFVMSLTENIARRKVPATEIIETMVRLKGMGYSVEDIALKVDLSKDYVGGILALMAGGEKRLVAAVESGRLGLSTALTIFQAADDDLAIQRAMHDAYESGQLKGKQFVQLRRLLRIRAKVGKSSARTSHDSSSTKVTSNTLVRTYRKEVQRQSFLVKRAESTQQKILVIVEAMKALITDEDFITLLKAEDLDEMPRYLAERLSLAKGA